MINKTSKTILGKIIETKKHEVEHAQKTVPLSHLKKQLLNSPPGRPFASCLRQRGRITLIAEAKRRSPSKGLIRRDFDVRAITRAYTKAGASAISVLTDRSFFGGDPTYIELARKNTDLPVLYKEFVIDLYQLYQARALGADAVLLIVKILTPSSLADLLGLAGELGLEALVETHNAMEIQQAITAGAKIIGINNRDLDTFHTDIRTTVMLRHEITDPRITIVSESGIRSRQDMEILAREGVHAALVGETLMRRPDLEYATRELLGYTAAGEVG